MFVHTCTLHRLLTLGEKGGVVYGSDVGQRAVRPTMKQEFLKSNLL